MIVCSCKVVSDHQIRDAAIRGLRWKQMVKETGLATECGACARHAKSIFDNERAQSHSSVQRFGLSCLNTMSRLLPTFLSEQKPPQQHNNEN